MTSCRWRLALKSSSVKQLSQTTPFWRVMALRLVATDYPGSTGGSGLGFVYENVTVLDNDMYDIIACNNRNGQLFLRINVIYINIHKGISRQEAKSKRITQIYYQ